MRVLDPQTSQPLTVDPERAQADFTAGKLQVVEGYDYTMVDAEGGVWTIPAKSVSQAIHAGYRFGGRADAVRAEAADPDQAWRAAADGAFDAAALGMGDMAQERLGLANADEIQARAEAHPGARAVGSAGGIAAQLLLTGGIGAGGGLAARAVGTQLAERGAGAAVQRVAAGVASGVVDGAVYGLGTGLSEAQLGNSEDVAEHMMAAAGAGALLGGAVGGAASTFAAGVMKGRARLKDYAALYAKGAGRAAPAGLPGVLRDIAEGRPVGPQGLELAAKEFRGVLDDVHSRAAAPVKPAANIRDYAAQEAAQAAAVAPLPKDFLRGGVVDSAKVSAFVRRLGSEPNVTKEAALREWMQGLPDDAAQTVSRALDDARMVAEASRAEGAAFALETALGEVPAWSGRAAGAAIGGVVGGPVGAGVGGMVGGMVANRMARPMHAEVQRAAVQRALTRVGELMGERAAVLVGTAKAAARGADAAGRGLERVLPATAVMLTAQSDAERNAAFLERAESLADASLSPGLTAERMAAATAHLDDAVPDTNAMVQVKAVEAIKFLASVMPVAEAADFLAAHAPSIPAHRLQEFARIDAVVQDPLRAMAPEATASEIRAVATVYPRLYGAMQQAIAKAITPAVSWERKKHLSASWGLQLHKAFTSNHVRMLQNAYAAPKRGPGRPPKPRPVDLAATLTEPERLANGI